MAIHAALSLSLIGSLALAFVLWWWADRVAGVRPLIGFLVGVAVWIAGNELPSWFGPATERAGLTLLATAALTSAVFLHFTVSFTEFRAPRLVAWGYGVGLSGMVLSVVLQPGRYEPFAGLRFVAIPNAVGWVTSAVWALLAAAGQIVLLRSLITQRGLARRQVGAVIASSAWGLACMSGYGTAALQLPMSPWPLLGLPLYPVFLVYGILRYELLLANGWARRALAWAILVAIAGVIVAAVPLLPVGTGVGARLVTASGVVIALLILGGPARRLAERIVYPGPPVTAEDLAVWRNALATVTDHAELGSHATTLLSARLSMPVRVSVGEVASCGSSLPHLACRRAETGWQSALQSGWEAAPPGPRRTAALFGAVLVEEAIRLDRAVALAEQERERQIQARLAELGALAATVAHDLRNPLNIISMAVATSDADIRHEVRDQVQRIARLTDELLDYAKPWSIGPTRVNVADLLRQAVERRPTVEMEAGLPQDTAVLADAPRLLQALDNLLDNAVALATRISIGAEHSGAAVLLHVCDDGPGIPADLRDRIFEPFVSRSPGGTGLGLAIVARIAAAHGGSVWLGERPGWSTCITLSLRAAI